MITFGDGYDDSSYDFWMDKIIFGNWLIKLNFDVKSQYDMKWHVGDKPFWSILFGQFYMIISHKCNPFRENLKTLKFGNLSLGMVWCKNSTLEGGNLENLS